MEQDKAIQPFRKRWFLQGGRLLAHAPQAGLFLVESRDRPTLRDDSTGRIVLDLPEFQGRVIRLGALGGSGQAVAMALSDPEELWLFRLDAKGQVLERASSPLPFVPVGIALLPTEDVAVAWSERGSVMRCGAVKGMLRTLATLESEEAPNFSGCFPMQGLFLGGGGNGSSRCPTRIWDLRTGEPREPAWDLSFVKVASFSPDGTLLALGSKQKISIVAAKSGRVLQEWWDEAGFSPMDVKALAWSPDGGSLASTSHSESYFHHLFPKCRIFKRSEEHLHRSILHREDMRFSTWDVLWSDSHVAWQDAEEEAIVWPTDLFRVRIWSLGSPHPRTVIDQCARVASEPVCFLPEGFMAFRLPGTGRPQGQGCFPGDRPVPGDPVQVMVSRSTKADDDPSPLGKGATYPLAGQALEVMSISPWTREPGNAGLLMQVEDPDGLPSVTLWCQWPL